MFSRHHRPSPPTSPSRTWSGILIGSALVVGLAACSSEPAKTAPDEKPTTTAKAAGTTAGTTSDAKSEPRGTVDESELPSWQRTAQPYRDMIGETVDVECDAGGDPGSLWGTNLYTDDSSVCTAAVQVGLITFDEGGTVTILIEEGASAYDGSKHNGVESTSYGSWSGSFSFPEADALEVDGSIPWSRPARYYDGETGDIDVLCGPDGEVGSVWGTDTYTDDSSICTAAVHAGLITLEDGGEVRFVLVGGEDAYVGSTANGVDTTDYGSFDGSFTFPTNQP